MSIPSSAIRSAVSSVFAQPGAGGGGGAPAPDLFLNTYSGAAFAGALQKLDKDYAGAAIKVRETGGETLADIGFDGNGDLDTTALLAHCGANDGFVHTIFDQSGNGRDHVQTTTTQQPKIVTAGSVITVNTKPAMLFDGNIANLALSPITTGDFLGASYEQTILAVMLQDSATDRNKVWEVIGAGNELTGLVATWTGNGIIWDSGDKLGSGRRVTLTPTGFEDIQQIVACQSDGANGEVRTNGVSAGTDTGLTGTPATTTSTTSTIGAPDTDSLGGNVQALIVYPNDTHALTDLEAALNAIWSVY